VQAHDLVFLIGGRPRVELTLDGLEAPAEHLQRADPRAQIVNEPGEPGQLVKLVGEGGVDSVVKRLEGASVHAVSLCRITQLANFGP
jgi:hypothetical protein